MYGGDRAMNVQAGWQSRLQAQDFHRSQPSSRTGTPSLASVVAAQNQTHSPSREGGSDDDKTDIKGETFDSGAAGDSSKMYLTQQRNDLLALQQQQQQQQQQQHSSYYTASTTLARLSSPNCKP
jgi:hypothetical protein